MKILITGAKGFLGTALCKQLEAQGHDLVRLNSKNCNLTKQDSLEKFNVFSAVWTLQTIHVFHDPHDIHVYLAAKVDGFSHIRQRDFLWGGDYDSFRIGDSLCDS